MSISLEIYSKISKDLVAAMSHLAMTRGEAADRVNAFYQTVKQIKSQLVDSNEPVVLEGLKHSLFAAYRIPHKMNLAGIVALSPFNPASMVQELGLLPDDSLENISGCQKNALDAITAAVRLHFASIDSIRLQTNAAHAVYTSVSRKIQAKMLYGTLN